MAGTDALEAVLTPVCAAVGVELFDVVHTGPVLEITIERAEPLDLDTVAAVTRAISDFLDAHEDVAPAGRYELEVSTPGLERRLRRPDHFGRATGETVAIRTAPGTEGPRRLEAVLGAADDEGFVVTVDGVDRRYRYDEVESVKTVFDWHEALRERNVRPGDQADAAGRTNNTTNGREARR